VSTIAGTGAAGWVDGPGLTQSRFSGPVGVSADLSSGIVYISDTGNNVIRMLNTLGMVGHDVP
jgi:NHL repeat